MPNVIRFGGGGAADGNAIASDVLKGKTFSSASGSSVEGTMPDNEAWGATLAAGETITVPAGYHNGKGTVTASSDSQASYQSGYDAGKADADKNVNKESESYKSGYTAGVEQGHTDVKTNPSQYDLLSSDDATAKYNEGVTYADSRLNTSSVSYTSGYDSGKTAGVSQGENNVKNNPSAYGLASSSDLKAQYNSGYSAGYSAGSSASSGTSHRLQCKVVWSSSDKVYSFQKWVDGTCVGAEGIYSDKTWTISFTGTLDSY